METAHRAKAVTTRLPLLVAVLVALTLLPLPALADNAEQDVITGNPQRIADITGWYAPRFANYGPDAPVPGSPDSGKTWTIDGYCLGMTLMMLDAAKGMLATRWSADSVVKQWVEKQQAGLPGLLPEIVRNAAIPLDRFTDSAYKTVCRLLPERGPLPVVLLDSRNRKCHVVLVYAVTVGKIFGTYLLRFYDPDVPNDEDIYGTAVYGGEDEATLVDWNYGGPKITLDQSHSELVSVDSRTGATYDRFFVIPGYTPVMPDNAAQWARPAE